MTNIYSKCLPILGIVIMILLLNAIYIKNNTETFLESTNLSDSEDSIDSEAFDIDLDNDGKSNIKILEEVDLNKDKKSDLTQFMDELKKKFKQFANNKTDIIDNNKLINTNIKQTIDNEEQRGKDLIEHEEVFDNDPIDSELPLKEPENLVKESNEMKNMFQKLEDAEYLCNTLDRRQKLKDNLEQMKINDLAFRELDEQDKQIEELQNILKTLRLEQMRRSEINNSCRNKNMDRINKDYHTIRKLASKGLIPKGSTKINLNVSSPELLKNQMNKIKDRYKDKKYNSEDNVLKCDKTCPGIDKSKMIHVNKLDNDLCMGCNKKVLSNKQVSDDFKT
jgi:hypothetical protein